MASTACSQCDAIALARACLPLKKTGIMQYLPTLISGVALAGLVHEAGFSLEVVLYSTEKVVQHQQHGNIGPRLCAYHTGTRLTVVLPCACP